MKVLNIPYVIKRRDKRNIVGRVRSADVNFHPIQEKSYLDGMQIILWKEAT